MSVANDGADCAAMVEKAGKASAVAGKFSAGSNSRDEHINASNSHDKAAMAHRAAAESFRSGKASRGASIAADSHDSQASSHSIAAARHRSEAGVHNETGDTIMSKLTEAQRVTIIDGLVANCDCWKDSKADLAKMDDKALNALQAGAEATTKLKEAGDQLKAQESVINAAKKGLEVGDGVYVLNDKNEWAHQPKTPAIVTNTEKREPIKLADLPLEITQKLAFADRIMNQQKAELVERLVANQADEAAKASRRIALNKLSLPELEDRIADLPPAQETAPTGYTPGMYAGQVAGRTVANQAIDKPEHQLGLPVWNWGNTAKV